MVPYHSIFTWRSEQRPGKTKLTHCLKSCEVLILLLSLKSDHRCSKKQQPWLVVCWRGVDKRRINQRVPAHGRRSLAFRNHHVSSWSAATPMANLAEFQSRVRLLCVYLCVRFRSKLGHTYTTHVLQKSGLPTGWYPTISRLVACRS